MLWTPQNQFNWSVNNFGATYTDAGIGVTSPGHANANTKGANTSQLVGIAQDCYGMAIGFASGSTSATIYRNLVDILIDPAAGVGNAGSTWSVLINNLYCAYASLGCGAYWYYFPLYLKAGTAIGSANQSNVAGKDIHLMINICGKPTKPELLHCGTKVETYGAVTGTTTGTAITPGTNLLGSGSGDGWGSSFGTSSYAQFWWQAGIGYNDTTIGGGTSISEATFLDVGVSTDAGTTKTVCAEHIKANFSTTEQGGKDAFGCFIPYKNMPSGATIYVRGAATIAPNTSPTAVVYGVGGG